MSLFTFRQNQNRTHCMDTRAQNMDQVGPTLRKNGRYFEYVQVRFDNYSEDLRLDF